MAQTDQLRFIIGIGYPWSHENILKRDKRSKYLEKDTRVLMTSCTRIRWENTTFPALICRGLPGITEVWCTFQSGGNFFLLRPSLKARGCASLFEMRNIVPISFSLKWFSTVVSTRTIPVLKPGKKSELTLGQKRQFQWSPIFFTHMFLAQVDKTMGVTPC